MNKEEAWKKYVNTRVKKEFGKDCVGHISEHSLENDGAALKIGFFAGLKSKDKEFRAKIKKLKDKMRKVAGAKYPYCSFEQLISFAEMDELVDEFLRYVPARVVRNKPRVCGVCGVDISYRPSNAVYCRKCARERTDAMRITNSKKQYLINKLKKSKEANK